MGIISFKFFSWYKLNKKNFMVLFFGLATATFAIAITEDAYTKLIFIYVLEEKSPSGAEPHASFIYLNSEKYKLIFFFYKREGVRETFKLNRLFSCRPTKGVKEFHLSFLVKILSSFLFLAQFQ